MYAANISLMFSRDVYSYTTVYISLIFSDQDNFHGLWSAAIIQEKLSYQINNIVT